MLRLKQLALLIGDLANLYGGLYLAVAIRYQHVPGKELTGLISPLSQLFILAAIILFIAGLYDIGKAKNSWSFYQKIIISALVWTIFGIMYFYINPKTKVTPKTILLLTALAGFGLISFWRYLYNRFISTTLKYNIIFAGRTKEVTQLINAIQNEPQVGYSVLGVIDENEPSSLALASANIIVLAPHMVANENLMKELYQSLFQQVSIVNLADFYETVMHRIPPFTFSEGWFVANLREQQKKIYDRFRILTDYVLAVVLGIFFALTFPFIALAIKSSFGP